MATKEQKRIYNQTYKRSVHGLLANLYKSMRDCSRKREHPLPTMTLKQFQAWAIMGPKFITLFGVWCSSGYCADLKPSVDRLDVGKPYIFSNMRIMTWVQNRELEYQRRRALSGGNGIAENE